MVFFRLIGSCVIVMKHKKLIFVNIGVHVSFMDVYIIKGCVSLRGEGRDRGGEHVAYSRICQLHS